MRKAIVAGATGFVGSAIVDELLKNNIEVLALGRKDLKETKLIRNMSSIYFKYLKIDMFDIRSLPTNISKIDWDPGDSCVFFNFAWAGSKRLSDGGIKEQIKNVTYSANAVLAAKETGCIKFVNCGSMEETFAEQFLNNDWKNKIFNSSQANYAVSKIASRDLCSLTAYLEKINYVHTRLSVPIDKNLTGKGYISNVLKNILKGNEYAKPLNNQLFDIISLNDVAKAYYLIGLKGKNKANYFIGTSNPKTLNQYFTHFNYIVNNINLKDKDSNLNYQLHNIREFDISELVNDTGFNPSCDFEEFAKIIKEQWKKQS